MGQAKATPYTGKHANAALRDAINEIAAQSAPARAEYFKDTSLAIQGLPQGIPAAQAAYRQGLSASEASVAALRDRYRSAGIEDRFATPALDEAGMEGRRSASDARQAIADAFQGQGPNAAIGAGGAAQQGLLGVAQNAQARGAASAGVGQALTSAGIGAAGQLAGYAAATYGPAAASAAAGYASSAYAAILAAFL